MAINLMTTLQGTLLEGFFPAGWDLAAIDEVCSRRPEDIVKRESWWNRKFEPIPCRSLEDFNVMMGHEIANEIRLGKLNKHDVVFILPVGPMGMYRWVVYFLREWGVDCKHVHGFNMDEWSDHEGNTVPEDDPGSFKNAMEGALYGPLGKLTVPERQRHFATKDSLPKFGAQIRALRKKGAKLITVFGIGRMCHIAFWEPQYAAEFKSVKEWKAQDYRLGAKLHPLTIEQNAITSFKSRTPQVPATANTVGPGLFLMSDKIIGGADGALGRGMMWQGMSLWMTLHLKPTPWITSTFMPTLPGKLFFLEELAGPLVAECN
jgi:glucosamine-6-phosphate deaminase